MAVNGFEDMRGKVFIVTGAAICRRLIACGAQVAVWDIADEAGQAMKNDDLMYVHCDVRDPQQAAWAVEMTVARFGKVDGLVNNAFWHADAQPPLHEMSLED